MNNDYSWYGLWVKGFNLQCRKVGEKEWLNLNFYAQPQGMLLGYKYQIRYKHSIQ